MIVEQKAPAYYLGNKDPRPSSARGAEVTQNERVCLPSRSLWPTQSLLQGGALCSSMSHHGEAQASFHPPPLPREALPLAACFCARQTCWGGGGSAHLRMLDSHSAVCVTRCHGRLL